MADPLINPEELALRRRARRRLVGSLALALCAVVVLPMLFEPEPKPLGDDVEIVIPSQETPFKPLTIPVAPPQTEPKATAAAPVTTPAPELPPPPASKASQSAEKADTAKRPETGKPEPLPAQAAKPIVKPAEKPVEKPTNEVKAKPTDVKPDAKPQAKTESKPETKPVTVTEAKSESGKAEAKPAQPAADAGHYLQLGAFGAETNARQLADKARAAGFSVKVIPGQGGHKVRVGPYPSKEKAVEAQARLKAKGFTPVLVAP
jgi:DedD protein